MTTVTACRSCGSGGLEPVLSLGALPLANALLGREQLDEPEERFPLDVVRCGTCTLVQITETVPPERLFADYPYFSSTSDTMLRHARALVDRMVAERRLGPATRAVEIASNDGYLLQFYAARGVPALGIEPAENVAAHARARGIGTRCAFFGTELARGMAAAGETADVLHAHNVLAHVPDLNGFVQGMSLVLREGGTAVVEVPYLADLLERCEFDTMYHEHLCYFSLTALVALFARHGLPVRDVERVAIHGGSLRLFAGRGPASPRVAALLAAERAWGVDRDEPYAAFARRVAALREELRALLYDLKHRGNRLAAYGASAKGTTLLNYVGVGTGVIDFVVDRSPAKQGRFTPGTHLPIHPPSKLLEERPDHVLLLTWNIAEEVLAQQRAYVEQGGRFVVPVPRPVIVP